MFEIPGQFISQTWPNSRMINIGFGLKGYMCTVFTAVDIRQFDTLGSCCCLKLILKNFAVSAHPVGLVLVLTLFGQQGEIPNRSVVSSPLPNCCCPNKLQISRKRCAEVNVELAGGRSVAAL